MTENRPSLPSAPQRNLRPNIVLQPPLSRCGRGPGLIIFRPSSYATSQQRNDSLDPEPLLKWAEESYAVAQITINQQSDGDERSVLGLYNTARDTLVSLEECIENDKFGVILYGSPIDYPPQFEHAFATLVSLKKAIVAVVYFDVWNIGGPKPVLLHAPGAQKKIPEMRDLTVYSYPDMSSPAFTIPGHQKFNISTAGIAHSRSLTFIKKHLNGPYFDLERIWEEHTYYEFGDRSVENTMATMVQEPYVNDVPTLTGGIGRDQLNNFYLHHFIFTNPNDASLELVSRTVGVDRIVDEFIFCLTHSKEIDWFLPGIPPTGKPLRVPFTSVVNIRGDRLYHEHIAWDQATVLVQLGLLPEYLPYPYDLPGGRSPAPGKRFEYRVPAAGVETAEKLKNEHRVPSNEMFEYKIREADNTK